MAKINILLTGRTGFLGKELEPFLAKKHNILNEPRFDLTNPDAAERVLKDNSVDVVIHTAAKGGKRLQSDTFQDFTDNISMFNNLIRLKSRYKLLFSFCSGAAFDRTQNLYDTSEEMILRNHPSDYYGLSKNIIARECLKHNNVFNFRLFGCFGRDEPEARFFSSLKRSITACEPMIIHQDKLMDFISAKDVCRVIDYYLDNHDKNLPRDINLVYDNKYSLSTLACKFRKMMGHPNHLIITGQQNGNSYTGDGEKLKDLKIELEGLEFGLKDCYASS